MSVHNCKYGRLILTLAVDIAIRPDSNLLRALNADDFALLERFLIEERRRAGVWQSCCLEKKN